MRDHGKQGGLIYERHRQKLDQSLGYKRDGNVTHYVSAGYTGRKQRIGTVTAQPDGSPGTTNARKPR